MALQTVLEQYGLGEKQAAIYLATLELGRAPVLRIADKAAVKRPTTYVVLHELLQMGLVDMIPRAGTKLFQAIDPKMLLERLQKKAQLLDQSLPQLRAIMNTAQGKPTVRFYEGKRAIYELYANEIVRQPELYSLINLDAFGKTYNEKEKTALLNAMKKYGCNATELVEDSEEARWYLKEKNRRGLGDTKLLPKTLRFDVDFVVYGNTFVTISLKNLIAVVTEDVAISSAQLQMFRFLYDSIEQTAA